MSRCPQARRRPMTPQQSSVVRLESSEIPRCFWWNVERGRESDESGQLIQRHVAAGCEHSRWLWTCVCQAVKPFLVSSPTGATKSASLGRSTLLEMETATFSNRFGDL